jgi:hypothetical protein
MRRGDLPKGRQLIKDGNGPDRGACSSTNFKGEANKPEPPAARQKMQVDEVFIMGKPQLPADLVYFPVGNSLYSR